MTNVILYQMILLNKYDKVMDCFRSYEIHFLALLLSEKRNITEQIFFDT